MLTPRRHAMLTRSAVVARRPGCVIAAVGLWLAAPAASAASAVAAEPPVDCPPDQTVCSVEVDTPPRAGRVLLADRQRAGSAPVCRIPSGQPGAGEPVSCTDRVMGRFNTADGCYYRRLEPQPARSDPAWDGHADGAVYEMSCAGVPGTGGGWVWRATPPAGPAAAVDPAVLAQQAVRQLALHGPAIRMAPPLGAMGLVHAPVWMWTPATATTWGPMSATASVPGLSVTATARAVAVRWDMGDGDTVTCTGPGTAYRPALGTASPSCGHVYQRSSAGKPGGVYPVTATTTWRITWSGGGEAGVLDVTRTTGAQARIGEMQALT